MVVMSNEYKVYHDWENPSILGNNSYMHQQKYINDGHSIHTKNSINSKIRRNIAISSTRLDAMQNVTLNNSILYIAEKIRSQCNPYVL